MSFDIFMYACRVKSVFTGCLVLFERCYGNQYGVISEADVIFK